MTETSTGFPRILVIATWFGPLPDYFCLWMLSCRQNSNIDWLLVTDADASSIQPPGNVHVVQLSMAEFASRISDSVGFTVAMDRPYKACDFRPLYACLTNLVPGHWDFWGHCDLDMLFGDIRAFLTPDMLEANDRVFGVGHFSLYRNNEDANNYYRRPFPNLDYRRILIDPQPRGFDEHIGVNLIWHHHGGRFHEDEGVVADIDPNIGHMRRTSNYIRVKNARHQIFAFDQGRVIRFWWAAGQLQSEEFMYIHFQKRRFRLPPPQGCERFWLTPKGFVPMEPGRDEMTAKSFASLVRQLNPAPLFPPLRELSHSFRRSARLLRRKLSGQVH